MITFFAETESGIKSDLIDLDRVPLTELRVLDNSELRRALRNVLEQTESRNVGGACSTQERLD
jgi:FXSXX-COOH protein